ncbi:MAG: hypothetical protein GOU98_04050 [Candidatus Altiarchaeota archaeon]|nr:hypothetical protein [Candidatus Altiarchaeota archaeon]
MVKNNQWVKLRKEEEQIVPNIRKMFTERGPNSEFLHLEPVSDNIYTGNVDKNISKAERMTNAFVSFIVPDELFLGGTSQGVRNYEGEGYNTMKQIDKKSQMGAVLSGFSNILVSQYRDMRGELRQLPEDWSVIINKGDKTIGVVGFYTENYNQRQGKKSGVRSGSHGVLILEGDNTIGELTEELVEPNYQLSNYTALDEKEQEYGKRLFTYNPKNMQIDVSDFGKNYFESLNVNQSGSRELSAKNVAISIEMPLQMLANIYEDVESLKEDLTIKLGEYTIKNEDNQRSVYVI